MDIHNLIEWIKSDIDRGGAYDRYPVRFFSIKYERGVSEGLIQLQQCSGAEIFDIKTLLPHEDAWISPSSLRQTFYESLSPMKSYIVVGFSEYARFLSAEKFITAILSLIELENPKASQKRRIYFPCFALYNQIKKIIGQYHRRLDVYDPLLNKAEVEELPRLYFVNDALHLDAGPNQVMNSAEWFGMWRNVNIDPVRPIICFSPTLSYCYHSASPDNVYNIKEIATFQDALRYMYQIEGIRAYPEDECGFYRQLISLLNARPGTEFGELILTELKVRSIDKGNFYSVWKRSNCFERWLLCNYILLETQADTYLYQIMLETKELSDHELIENIYLRIFALNQPSFCEERKALLSSVQEADKEIRCSDRILDYYGEMLTNLFGMTTAANFRTDEPFSAEKREATAGLVPYLTCFSAYERQLIIWLYRSRLLSDSELQHIYPALACYLNGGTTGKGRLPNKAEAYLQIYREARLARRSGEDYDCALSAWNKDDVAFYAWYFDDQIDFPEKYLKNLNFEGKLYVLDGVGAEFINYLCALLKERGFSIDTCCYGKSRLPSTSSMAKEAYPPCHKWMLDFDQEIVHGRIYYHVENLEGALTKLEALIDQIATEVGNQPFAIISDHGASVGHKLCKREKKYDFEQSDHDGRCCQNKTGQAVSPTPDYLIYDDEKNRQWVIALNPQSLYHQSKYAVHGGATPEEILIPVIIAYKGRRLTQSHRAEAINLKVSGLQKTVEIKIIPASEDLPVKLSAADGTSTTMSYNRNTKTWTGELKTGIEQEIRVTVEAESFIFRTVPPTRMGGDDLFDD